MPCDPAGFQVCAPATHVPVSTHPGPCESTWPGLRVCLPAPHFRRSHLATPGELAASSALPGSPIEFSLSGAWMAWRPSPSQPGSAPPPPFLPSETATALPPQGASPAGISAWPGAGVGGQALGRQCG
ncbi:unnamed protein product [Rangifer tarandus platyrhynchus]|uniref:Uncharacterized protein n=1 Tax=Rangifer tarandus platyrhynchus TaxID=3082113 RepID=A0AC59YQT6_RANTA